MSEHITKSEVDAIRDLALAAGEIHDIEGTPFIVLQKNQTAVNLERFKTAPVRKSGNIDAQDLKGFLKLYGMHQSEQTVIYADRKKARFCAVFNDHTASQTGWRDHTSTYTCPHSNEWVIWQKQNGVQMSQEGFAVFIEQNLPDIVDPAGAQMLEISRSLQAKRNATFASAVNLHNGANHFKYEEDIKGTTLGGTLEIPQNFTLGLQVFLNGEAYRMDALLRYRIDKENHLIMWYELVRHHDIYEDAFNAVSAQIEAETKADIINANL